MVRSSWSALLALDGYTTVVGVAEEVLVTIERGLGIEFPAELRSLYAASDGVYDEVGQWWVIWPLERLTTQNHGPERIADLPEPDGLRGQRRG